MNSFRFSQRVFFFALTLVCLFPIFGSSAVAQTRIIIARHGTASYDPKNPQMINGIPEPSLSDKGKDEALRLARLAKAEGIEVIYHSPLMRARETAAIVARETNLKPIVVEALAELNLGDLLGKEWNESPYREQLAEVLRHPDNKRPGGESFNELHARATAALRDIMDKNRNKKILIIAHSITNRALIGMLRGLSTAEAYRLPSQPNDEAFIVRWTSKIPAEIETRRY